MKYLLILTLVACSSKKVPLRPLATGTFGKYEIAVCPSGGHVVKLTLEVDERGEAANRRLVELYRDRYLLPKLEPIEVKGWTFDGTCGLGGLTLTISPAHAAGEALHRIGATLARNPTDIEVTVVAP